MMSLVTPSVRRSVKHSARQQDRRNHRRAAGSAGEATARRDEKPPGRRPVRGSPRRRATHPIVPPVIDSWTRREVTNERDDHQHGDAQALGPWRAAEKQPPQENQQRGDDRAQSSRSAWTRGRDREEKPDQHQQHRDDDAGPEPERLSGSRFVGASVLVDAVCHSDSRSCLLMPQRASADSSAPRATPERSSRAARPPRTIASARAKEAASVGLTPNSTLPGAW